MESQIPPPRHPSHHPLMIVAAIAVVLFCLVGIAAVLGWLPSSIGGNPANRPLDVASGVAPQNGAPGLAPAPAQPVAATGPATPQPSTPAAAPVRQPAAPAPAAAPHAPARPTQLAANERTRHWCSNCGNIESIRTITTRARGSGLGAAGGAVLGGLLGNQVGSGNGRSLATVAGAVGGAVLGNRVEGNMHAAHTYEIRVRLDDGTLRTFHQSNPPAWHEGERVRIVKGHLHRD